MDPTLILLIVLIALGVFLIIRRRSRTEERKRPPATIDTIQETHVETKITPSERESHAAEARNTQNTVLPAANPPTVAAQPQETIQPPPPHGIWNRLEHTTRSLPAGRPLGGFRRMAHFSTTERIKESLPREVATFENFNRISEQLAATHGSGFSYAVRDSNDAVISPPWLSVRSIAYDRGSGRIVAAGLPNHSLYGLDAAYDLGAIDGRNMATFPKTGNTAGVMMPAVSLYVGSTKSGALVPLDMSVNVVSVDLFGPNGTISSLDFLGSSAGAVTLRDDAGTRRILCVLEGLSMGEKLSFSGDGAWILIAGSRDSTLVDVATGRHVSVGVANAGWWPAADSTLLTIEHDGDVATPKLFDLSRNSYVKTFPPITLDQPGLKNYQRYWYPTTSPDGSQVLAYTPSGVTDEYQQLHGAHNHLARIGVETGLAEIVRDVFVDDEDTLERDVGEVRWFDRGPRREVRLHPELASHLQDPVTEHDYLSNARWADEAEQVLIRSLNRLLDLTNESEDGGHLLPEILASLVVVASDSAVWERQSEWLINLNVTTQAMVWAGTLSGPLAETWSRFGRAMTSIREKDAGRIDLIGVLTVS